MLRNLNSNSIVARLLPFIGLGILIAIVSGLNFCPDIALHEARSLDSTSAISIQKLHGWGILWPIFIPFTGGLIALYYMIRTSTFLNHRNQNKKATCRKRISGHLHRAGSKVLDVFTISRNSFVPFLASTMVLIFMTGWVLYYLAIYYTFNGLLPVQHTVPELFFYSGASALDMFMMDINGNILDNIPEHSVLKGFITATAAMAMLSMSLLLVGLILSRLRAAWHSSHLVITPDDNTHIYVFFGINEPSLLLAHSIKETSADDPNYDDKSLIIFVEKSLDDEDDSDGWNTILNLFSHRKRTFSSVNQDDHEALMISNCKVSNVPPDAKIWKTLGLKQLDKILNNRHVTESHFFFLSPDRQANLSDSIALAENEEIIQWADKKMGENDKFSSAIYCLARQAGGARDLESFNTKIPIKIVDESRLSVNYLRSNSKFHPVNFVKVDYERDPGTVDQPFKCLIVGFGETGQDAAKFLYEYSAFEKGCENSDLSQRTPFVCHVFDKEAYSLRGRFKAMHPGIADEMAIDSQSAFVFHKGDHRSARFFQILKELGPELNMAVVASGDDEQNIEIAVEILRYLARQCPDGLPKTKILVRSYQESQKLQLEKIRGYYNNQYHPQEDTIILFGQRSEIMTYSMIVRNAFVAQGKKYNERYNLLAPYPADWEKRHQEIRQGDLATSTESQSQEEQDISNAQHAATKLIMIQQFCQHQNIKIEDFINHIFPNGDDKPDREGEKLTIRYPKLDDFSNRFMTNMAKTEHFRWNASHIMRGYRLDPTCPTGKQRDYRRGVMRLHDCLTTWDQLATYPSDKIIYDYLVIETTLLLYRDSQLVFDDES